MSQEKKEWQQLGKSLYDYQPNGDKNLHFNQLQQQLNNKPLLQLPSWRWFYFSLFFLGTSAGLLFAWNNLMKTAAPNSLKLESPRISLPSPDENLGTVDSSSYSIMDSIAKQEIEPFISPSAEKQLILIPESPQFNAPTATTIDSAPPFSVDLPIDIALIESTATIAHSTPSNTPMVVNPTSSTGHLPAINWVTDPLPEVTIKELPLNPQNSLLLASLTMAISPNIDPIIKVKTQRFKLDGGYILHIHNGNSPANDNKQNHGFYVGLNYWQSLSPDWNFGIRLGYRHHYNYSFDGWISHRQQANITTPNGITITSTYRQRYTALQMWNASLHLKKSLSTNLSIQSGIQYGYVVGRRPARRSESEYVVNPFLDYNPKIIRRHNAALQVAINYQLDPYIELQLGIERGLIDLGPNLIIEDITSQRTDAVQLGINFTL